MAKFFEKCKENYINRQKCISFIQDEILPQLLSGKTIKVDAKTLFEIIDYMNYYGINTLMIQQDGLNRNAYYCRVCEATVRAYLQEREEIKCPKLKPLEAPIFF